MRDINQDILTFQRLTGLSDDRVGKLLANNGMLVPRARKDGRRYQETVQLIAANLARLVDERELDRAQFKVLAKDAASPSEVR